MLAGAHFLSESWLLVLLLLWLVLLLLMMRKLRWKVRDGVMEPGNKQENIFTKSRRCEAPRDAVAVASTTFTNSASSGSHETGSGTVHSPTWLR